VNGRTVRHGARNAVDTKERAESHRSHLLPSEFSVVDGNPIQMQGAADEQWPGTTYAMR
jgi:hypothetical protein